MTIALFKALHIIGFVAWFSGLFYLVRIFVYHSEAKDKPEPNQSILIEQFKLMEWRVINMICTPTLILTWIGGLVMLYLNPAYVHEGWLHIKLLFVILLTGYHHWCRRLIKKFDSDSTKIWSSQKLRQFNEVPTLILVIIVFLAVYRGGLNAWYAIGGFVVFAVLLQLGIRLYRRSRNK